MAKRKNTTKIIISILIGAIVLYLIYIFTQQRQKKDGGGEWHNFNWGGSQMNGTEVLLCCTDNVQNILKVGDKVELDITSCSSAMSHILNTQGHICSTKPCVCRGDLSGVHEVVGFGDDSTSSFADKGFRIKTNWQGSSFPSVDIASGKWRKVNSLNWW
jgi:hypothetical protein